MDFRSQTRGEPFVTKHILMNFRSQPQKEKPFKKFPRTPAFFSNGFFNQKHLQYPIITTPLYDIFRPSEIKTFRHRSENRLNQKNRLTKKGRAGSKSLSFTQSSLCQAETSAVWEKEHHGAGRTISRRK